MRLAQVLPNVVRCLELRDLQALLCCQRLPLISLEMVVQCVAFQASDLLRLIRRAKDNNLACHLCYKHPLATVIYRGTYEWCRRCDRRMCNHCLSRCPQRPTCQVDRVLCVACRAAVCGVPGCETCSCVEATRCACGGLVCSQHRRECKRCAATCCSRCAAVLAIPLINKRYSICARCTAAHRDALNQCTLNA